MGARERSSKLFLNLSSSSEEMQIYGMGIRGGDVVRRRELGDTRKVN